jgi:hypothetical protein
MKPSIQTVGQILYSPSQYIIPVFQRNYRWDRPQWSKFWESLEEIQQPGKRGNHFMGFLVFVPELAQPGQHTRFHMIDGQQRLTTLSVLLMAIRNVARNFEHNELADEIEQYYLVHPLKKGEEYFRLLPKERDHDNYVALIASKDTPAGRLSDALDYFEKEATQRAAIDPTSLRALFDTIGQRLEFMCATLETENAYNIFKSLNSTGVPLGASDLIRNFVFMHVSPENHDEFDREFWHPLEQRFARGDSTFDEGCFSRFFRDFLMSFGRYVPPHETFPTFEARYEATDFSPHTLASALLNASEDYEVITGARPDVELAITEALAGLNAFESPTTYPLLLALFTLRRRGKLGSQELARGVEMLCRFICRRSVCGESSRGYGQIFVPALSGLEDEPLKRLESYLHERGWPDDDRFLSSFVRFPLYQQRYAKHLLETLERARGHKEPADLRETQIEHILPQTLNANWRTDLGSAAEQIHAEWLHSPGNLTLSGYNLELWNHRFAVKRSRYAQSNVVLTRELVTYDHWDEETIRSRGQQLAAEAARLWIGPSPEIVALAKVIASSLDLQAKRTLAALKALRSRRQMKLDALSGAGRQQAEDEIAEYDRRIAQLLSQSGEDEAEDERVTGRELNLRWNVEAQHALYRKNGTWYHLLERFPGALFDEHGYVLFASKDAVENSSGILTGKRANWLNVPEGIASLKGYVRVR